MKLQTGIRHWETSENFKRSTSQPNARQNKRTNQVIIKKENENEVK